MERIKPKRLTTSRIFTQITHQHLHYNKSYLYTDYTPAFTLLQVVSLHRLHTSIYTTTSRIFTQITHQHLNYYKSYLYTDYTDIYTSFSAETRLAALTYTLRQRQYRLRYYLEFKTRFGEWRTNSMTTRFGESAHGEPNWRQCPQTDEVADGRGRGRSRPRECCRRTRDAGG